MRPVFLGAWHVDDDRTGAAGGERDAEPPPASAPDATMISDDDLARLVRESNAIEGIYAEPGDPDWDNHWKAAEYVRAEPGPALMDPRRIHRLMLPHRPEVTPGRYRRARPGLTGNVTVGGDIKMPWRDVPKAMTWLSGKAAVVPLLLLPAEALWAYHYEFEVIHPFFDGNGRVGRLWVNALAEEAGHPWMIVLESQRQDYYEAIRRWESNPDRTLPPGMGA
jgi:hypothetical protein